MAKIGDDRMIVRMQRRADGSWLFTICYTACFSDDEIGQRFDDSVQILNTGDGRAMIGEYPVAFTAATCRVFRKKRMVLPAGPYCADDMSVWIRLQHSGTDICADDAQCAPPVHRAGAA